MERATRSFLRDREFMIFAEETAEQLWNRNRKDASFTHTLLFLSYDEQISQLACRSNLRNTSPCIQARLIVITGEEAA